MCARGVKGKQVKIPVLDQSFDRNGTVTYFCCPVAKNNLLDGKQDRQERFLFLITGPKGTSLSSACRVLPNCVVQRLRTNPGRLASSGHECRCLGCPLKRAVERLARAGQTVRVRKSFWQSVPESAPGPKISKILVLNSKHSKEVGKLDAYLR